MSEQQEAVMTADHLRPWIAKMREQFGEPEFRIDGKPAYLVRVGEKVRLCPWLHGKVKPGKRHDEWLVPADL